MGTSIPFHKQVVLDDAPYHNWQTDGKVVNDGYDVANETTKKKNKWNARKAKTKFIGVITRAEMRNEHPNVAMFDATIPQTLRASDEKEGKKKPSKSKHTRRKRNKNKQASARRYERGRESSW